MFGKAKYPKTGGRTMKINLKDILADDFLTKQEKLNLKKSDYKIDYKDQLLISIVENDASDAQKCEFEKLVIEDSKFLDEYNLYRNTIISQDFSIVFEEKNSLKKREIMPIIVKFTCTIAASIILFFGIKFLFNEPISADKFDFSAKNISCNHPICQKEKLDTLFNNVAINPKKNNSKRKIVEEKQKNFEPQIVEMEKLDLPKEFLIRKEENLLIDNDVLAVIEPIQIFDNQSDNKLIERDKKINIAFMDFRNIIGNFSKKNYGMRINRNQDGKISSLVFFSKNDELLIKRFDFSKIRL